MAGEKVKIKKVLTHDFEVKGEVQNFDDIMQKILDKVTFLDVECNKQSIFISKANTSLSCGSLSLIISVFLSKKSIPI